MVFWVLRCTIGGFARFSVLEFRRASLRCKASLPSQSIDNDKSASYILHLFHRKKNEKLLFRQFLALQNILEDPEENSFARKHFSIDHDLILCPDERDGSKAPKQII